MNVKFCGECGSPVREGARFCAQCGWKIDSESQQPAQQARADAPPPGPGAPAGYGAAPPPADQRRDVPYSGQYAGQHPAQYPGQAPKKRRGGLTVGIIALILVAAAGVYMLFFRGGGLPIPGGSVAAEDLSGRWEMTITPEKITVDGKESPEYAQAVGIKTKGELNLNLAAGGKGDGVIQGEVYGYPFSDGVLAEYKGNRLTLKIEYPDYDYSTVYEGKVNKKDGGLTIEGSYTMESKQPAGLMKTTGTWAAVMGGAASPQGGAGPDSSKAKKDATLSDIAGTWTGTAVYTKIQGFEENAPLMKEQGMPDEALDMIREFEGSTVDFSLEVEDTGEWSFELPFLMGEVMDLDHHAMISDEDRDMGQLDKYHIDPQEGVFSLESRQTEEEGNFNLSFDGVIYEDGGLKIDGNISFEISFVDGAPITMLVEYTLTGHTPLE